MHCGFTAIHQGDTVKLTERYSKTLVKTPRKAELWNDRRGVVSHVNCRDVWIKWPGRISCDQLPIKAVEKV